MRFLLDVHVASSIARALERRGHDVLGAIEAHAMWTDRQLLDLAVAEGRVLVSQDSDFSELVFRDGALPPPSILYLRADPAEQPSIAEQLLLVLENVELSGHMVVIRATGFRRRALPTAGNDNG